MEIDPRQMSDEALERAACDYQKMAAADARIALEGKGGNAWVAEWQCLSASAAASARIYLFELIDRKAAK